MREIAPQREGRIVPGSAPRRAAPSPARARTAPTAAASFVAVMGQLAARFGQVCLDRPAETAGGFVVLCAAGYVSLNALGFQDGRHPAPILPKPKPVAARAAPASAPAKERPRPDAPVANNSAPQPEGSAALAKLVAETTASVTPRADKDVLQAQKALGKLGYGPIKDDGMMGPGTKAALVKFEREHKLPVTGEANGRTLKELAALAGRKR